MMLLAGQDDRMLLQAMSTQGVSSVLHRPHRHPHLFQLQGRLHLPALHSPPGPEIHGILSSPPRVDILLIFEVTFMDLRLFFRVILVDILPPWR